MFPQNKCVSKRRFKHRLTILQLIARYCYVQDELWYSVCIKVYQKNEKAFEM